VQDAIQPAKVVLALNLISVLFAKIMSAGNTLMEVFVLDLILAIQEEDCF
jgi:hypothetical protein